MYYSYTFNNGPTFEIHPELNRFWGIYGNDQHIINCNDTYTCIEMVARHNAIPDDFPEEIHQYGQHLPPLGQWETVTD
ncbi:hypothetical protein ACQ0P8_03975 [Halodesulfovibrio aestuarii]|uniref:Uncharacterized protein n=1 Tax=Halodesulfovibrio aestuarii TaxID=126333 RepID=A0A8G2F8B3_9BACT|nr:MULTISPECIES: hypothetical protein [Halodesulfovibrio]KAF1073465.1 hypothetical protein MKHDV_03599 [Halodesulfovibrio sp. MK-HDV]SHI73612.1 hypothetical protein SAMN05660830_00822 [Halodesulfovibrio aestuarii]